MLAILVVGLYVQTFVMETYRIRSSSMEPALQVGDCVLVSKISTGPRPGRSLLGGLQRLILPPRELRRGDMVVFHFPPDPRRELVKRVVAVPGDRLRLHGGRLFLEGEPVPEPYAFYAPAQPEIFRDEFPNLREADPGIDPRWWRTLRRLGADGELTVPPKSFFVLGDNRNNSEDSRYWGFVPQALVIGRPQMVYFAVPSAEGAPADGPSPSSNVLDRLHWLIGHLRQRVGLLH